MFAPGWSRREKDEEQTGAVMDIPHHSSAVVPLGKRSQYVCWWGREEEGVVTT